MSVRREGELIVLDGECRVEDAEPLAVLLQQNPAPAVDLSACRTMHSAVVQVLLSYRANISVRPLDPFLRDFVFSNVGQPGVAVEG